MCVRIYYYVCSKISVFDCIGKRGESVRFEPTTRRHTELLAIVATDFTYNMHAACLCTVCVLCIETISKQAFKAQKPIYLSFTYFQNVIACNSFELYGECCNASSNKRRNNNNVEREKGYRSERDCM